MPLRAQKDDRNIYAFTYDEPSWNDLKAHSKQEPLQMPCCDARAIPKTSKLGNFFFAHHVKRTCQAALETQEHIYLKSLIARAAKDAGWDVKTEWPGATPDNKQWIADVHCEKGGVVKVFEVQLSKLSKTQINERQQWYADSNVKTVWLGTKAAFKKHAELSSISLPLFLIDSPKIGVDPNVLDFNVSLSDFVAGILQTKLAWRPCNTPSNLLYVADSCWKCKKRIKQVCGGDGDYLTGCKGDAKRASEMLENISSKFDSQTLIIRGLNYIAKTKVFNSDYQGYPYCNHCPHCHAYQSNERLLEKLKYIVIFGKESVRYMACPLVGPQHGEWVFHNEK